MTSAKHTPASFFSSIQAALCCEYGVSSPPPPSEGIFCYVPYIPPVDTHSYVNEDSQCRFFFLHQGRAEVLQGCITCQHLHPVEVSWQDNLLMLMLLPQYGGLKPKFFPVLQLFQRTFCLVSLYLFKKNKKENTPIA